MTPPWEWKDEYKGKSYARQLRLIFKRKLAGLCVDCGKALDGDSKVRCEKHLAYQRGRGKRENKQ